MPLSSYGQMSFSKGGNGNGNGNGAYVVHRPTETSSYYKKFHLRGLIEFDYINYTQEREYAGKKTKGGWTSFDQIYRVGIQGFIYNPKLALFAAGVSYKRDTTTSDNNSGDLWKSNEITYDLAVNFLPTRPVNLSVYATKTDSDMTGVAGLPGDITSTLYGARLLLHLKNLPVIRMEYSHSDYSFTLTRGKRVAGGDIFFDEPAPFSVVKERVKESQIIDKYSLTVTGLSRRLRTRYSFGFDLSQHTNTLSQYDALFFRLITGTTLKKETSVSTAFQYSDIDRSKLMSFNSFVRLAPIKRIYQSYGFEYLSSDTDTGSSAYKSTLYTFNGILRYRYSTRISSRANFHYRFGDYNGNAQKAYDLNFNVNYGRPIRGFDFTTYAGFSAGKEEKNGEFQSMSGNVGFILSTRKLRWARVSFKYDFRYLSIDFKPGVVNTDEMTGTPSESSMDIENKAKLTVHGRGPGRAFWTAEAEARFLTSTNKGPGAWRSVWFGDEPYGRQANYFTLYADVGHPVGRRGLLTLRTSYTTGKTNTDNVIRYYYEGRFRYTIFRNMNISAWWREEWHNRAYWNNGLLQGVSTQSEIKTRNYSFNIFYIWRRVTFTLEYSSQLIEEDLLKTTTNRLYIKINRIF